MENFGSILSFLEQNNLLKTAKAFKDDLDQDASNSKADPRVVKDMLKMFKKVVTVKENLESKNKTREPQVPEKKRPVGSKALTPEETENIMGKFLNKLVNKPLPVERLNPKVEKLLNHETFQKMFEASETLQDVSNLSSESPQVNRNVPAEPRTDPKKETIPTETSWDPDSAQRFGGNPADLSDMLLEGDFSLNQQTQNKKQPHKLKLPVADLKGAQISAAKSQEENRLQKQDTKEIFSKGEEEKSAFEGLGDHPGRMPSMIHHQGNNDSSLFLQNSQSFVISALEDQYANAVDEYTDDDDPGFDLYEVAERDFVAVAKQLADKYGFPGRSCAPGNEKDDGKQDKETERNRNQFTPTDDSGLILQELKNKKDGKADDASSRNNDLTSRTDQEKKPKGYIHLPPHLKHPPSKDNFYPVVFENVIYDCFTIKVIYDRERTGFEETKDFPIVINSIVAGRYQILQYLGSAAFSKAIECLDMTTQQRLCMKVIENNKDYFDQSVDEIKLLKFINHNADVDEKCVLKFYDYFYHKEHLFIVTELLKENLYEFSKLNREREKEPYFTIGRLQKITKQILIALDYIHGLNLIHCDLKPENILLKDYENAEVKVIDFGSSCFIHDHLSSYVQSRSYRAPEVIIGCKYDYKIDMWSLGCILAELWTGNVLFQNDTVQGLLARVIGIIGAFPEHMFKSGRLVSNFFTKEKLLYQEAVDEGESHAYTDNSEVMTRKRGKTGKVQILVPKKSSLKHRLRTNDLYFLDFVRGLLEIDPAKRPTAREAMGHPWLTECRYQDPPYGGKKDNNNLLYKI